MAANELGQILHAMNFKTKLFFTCTLSFCFFFLTFYPLSFFFRSTTLSFFFRSTPSLFSLFIFNFFPSYAFSYAFARQTFAKWYAVIKYKARSIYIFLITFLFWSLSFASVNSPLIFRGHFFYQFHSFFLSTNFHSSTLCISLDFLY